MSSSAIMLFFSACRIRVERLGGEGVGVMGCKKKDEGFGFEGQELR